jgi:hypothetical protein
MRRNANPELFRRMSEPYDTADAANAALEAFYADVKAAREKHRIAQVYVIAETNVKYESFESPAMSTASFGSGEHSLAMVAWAFGREQEQHEELIAAMRAAGRKK